MRRAGRRLQTPYMQQITAAPEMPTGASRMAGRMRMSRYCRLRSLAGIHDGVAMKERKRRTRRQRKEDRRVRLIEAAERLFLRKGFDDASVEEISERAGCSPGAFYSHFDNKEQALRAVIDMRRPAAMQALDRLFLRIPKHEDPIAAVRRAVFRSVAAMGLRCDEIRPAAATEGFRPFGEPESGRDRPSELTG